MAATNRDLTAELRGALMEAKEAMEGKRQLNTLDNLIVELKKSLEIIVERCYMTQGGRHHGVRDHMI